jgi:hypothetical protein
MERPPEIMTGISPTRHRRSKPDTIATGLRDVPVAKGSSLDMANREGSDSDSQVVVGVAEPIYLHIDHGGAYGPSLIEVAGGRIRREIELAVDGLPLSVSRPEQNGPWSDGEYNGPPGSPAFEQEWGASRIARGDFEALYAQADANLPFSYGSTPWQVNCAISCVAEAIIAFLVLLAAWWLLQGLLALFGHLLGLTT